MSQEVGRGAILCCVKVRETKAVSLRAGVDSSLVRVFDYLDYREYLREVYARNKAVNKSFSCRFVATRVGFKSASFFSQILHGRSELTPSMAYRFAMFLKLGIRETDYLETLVLYARAEGVAERRRYLERLASFRDGFADAAENQNMVTVMVGSAAKERVEKEFAEFRSRVQAIAQGGQEAPAVWLLDLRLVSIKSE